MTHPNILFLIILSVLTQSKALPSTPVQNTTPIHQKIIVGGGFCFLFLGLVIWMQNEKQEKRVQFTEFNSQYVGKDSTRSNSQFPNFDLDVMKEASSTESQIGSEKSIERQKRRRKRKVNRIEKQGQNEIEGPHLE